MATFIITCFRCKTQTKVEGTRVSLRETCSKCLGDLHCCRHCKFYDRNAYNECKEPQAERTLDKEKANRCDYFKPAEGGITQDKSQDVKKKLDDLFK